MLVFMVYGDFPCMGFLVAVGLAIFAFTQRQIAEEQRQVADEQRQVAQMREREAEQAAEAESVARKEAESQRQEAITQRQVADDQRQLAQAKKQEAEQAALKVKRAGILTAASGKTQAGRPTMAALLVTELADGDKPYGGLATVHEVATSALSESILAGHTSLVYHAAFSPDGTRIVTASIDKTARVWRADGRGEPVVLTGHTDWVRHAAFSPDGTRIVTASRDGTARVWPADGKGEPIVLKGHDGGVNHAAFSPDGAWIVTASTDGTARVWRADGRGEPVVLTGHTSYVTHAAFSPDGTRIVTASGDRAARVWRVEWKTLLTYLREAMTVCLTKEQRICYLGEEDTKAQAAYETCERRYGRKP